MRTFRISIQADKYLTYYFVQASDWPTALARAVQKWRSGKGKGSRTDQINIRAIKGVKVNWPEENE